MKHLILQFVFSIFLAGYTFAQIPQNIETEAGEEGQSLWNSTTAMILAGVIILLLIIGRTWSKKVHDKRDKVSGRKEEDEK
ncbi:MAG: hypothetical protein R3277_06420 [Brumimicrobium sp.]|nr:hypothetical protein [Brumimicrobium sp.]